MGGMEDAALTPAILPPVKVDAARLPRIREALAAAHAADVRHAARAGLAAPEAPTIAIVAETPERYCAGCDTTHPGAIGAGWISRCCKVPVRDRVICTISIAAPRPTVGDWELIGVIEPQPRDHEGNPSPNLLRAVPGATVPVPARYRTADGTLCDHCNVRRARVETFAVASVADPSTVRQIGRNCLAAFLGGQSYEMIARRLAWGDAISEAIGDGEGWGSGGRGPDAHPIATVLALTASVIRRDGWAPRGKAREMGTQATADQISALINPPAYGSIAWQRWRAEMARVAPEDGDAAHASEALAWVRELTPRTDYEHSIRTIGRLADVETKNLGIACSIVPAFDRATAPREALPTAYLGTVGAQVGGTLTAAKRRAGTVLLPAIVGTVEACHAGPTDWGVSTRIEVRGDDGTTLAQWWKSGEAPADLRIGARVEMRGTIKAHRERGGQRLTVITRGMVTVIANDSAALDDSGG